MGDTCINPFQPYVLKVDDFRIPDQRTMLQDDRLRKESGEPYHLIRSIRKFVTGKSKKLKFEPLEPDIVLYLEKREDHNVEVTGWAEWDAYIYGENQLGLRFITSKKKLLEFADDSEKELVSLIKSCPG
jgi:hypothetical protein